MSTIKTWLGRMTPDYSGNTQDAMGEEIAELRAALAAMEQLAQLNGEIAAELRAAQAQPKAEPVQEPVDDVGPLSAAYVKGFSEGFEKGSSAAPQAKPLTDDRALRSLLGAALGALRYHTEQTRPIERTRETIRAIEHELSAHGIGGKA